MTSIETLYPNRAAFSSCGWAFLLGDSHADLCACPTSNLKNTAHSSAAANEGPGNADWKAVGVTPN